MLSIYLSSLNPSIASNTIGSINIPIINPFDLLNALPVHWQNLKRIAKLTNGRIIVNSLNIRPMIFIPVRYVDNIDTTITIHDSTINLVSQTFSARA